MKKSKALPAANDVLFEIGAEELPATNLADIFESASSGAPNPLEEKLKKAFEEKRLAFAEAVVWATPRRLVFWVKAVAPAQTAKDNLTRVLSKEEGYGADGQPTEKLLTILKHRGATINETVMGDSGGKPYVFIRKSEPVEKTAVILPSLFEALVKSLAFPKNMKWDESGIYFPRPIRSYLCLYGAKPVKFNIGATRVDNRTVIFSKGRRKILTVKDIPSYFKALEKKGVILEPSVRKEAIRRELDKLAESLKAKLYDDPFLLSEVNFLVENPHALSAPFGEEFLKLPLEVLTVSMARKQRLFGVLDGKGKVMPRFLAVLDGPATAAQRKIISTNMENILHAKLQDSLFFYREDAKVGLEKRREELKNLVFLKGAGSMLEKSGRLGRLAVFAGVELELSATTRQGLEKACYLAKADLLTQMVGEFPELQGVMGKYYAVASGESSETAEAIGEQYLPRTVHDKLPATTAGSLLSALDKIDLITACFGLGLEPSSSLDPYGLRRSATAVLKIFVDKKINLSLSKLLALAKAELGAYVLKDKEAALAGRLASFFKDRFKALLADRGFSEELIEAAMASDFDKPYECFRRVEALSAISAKEAFQKAAKIVERTSNILKGNKEPLPASIDPALFVEELEREVSRHYESAHESIRRATAGRDFAGATSLYAEAFFDILEQFFEKVFVNAEDMQIRKNRLALLKAVKDLYTAEIADLSKIRSARN